MDLNRATIIGRLTADPESRTTPQGTAVTSFRLATNFVWTDQSGQRQEKVEYHSIVAWRKLAETCAQYLRKGSKIYLEGRLQTRDWEGQDGVKRYRTEIVADNMIMLDKPTYSSENSGQGFQPRANVSPRTTVASDEVADTVIPQANTESSEEIKIEDIPF